MSLWATTGGLPLAPAAGRRVGRTTAWATTTSTASRAARTRTNMATGALARHPPRHPPRPSLIPSAIMSTLARILLLLGSFCGPLAPSRNPPPPSPPPPPPPTTFPLPPPSPGPPGSGTCVDSCIYADDGDCDDGGSGAEYSLCDPCTDCGDCGPRAHCDFGLSPPPPPPGAKCEVRGSTHTQNLVAPAALPPALHAHHESSVTRVLSQVWKTLHATVPYCDPPYTSSTWCAYGPPTTLPPSSRHPPKTHPPSHHLRRPLKCHVTAMTRGRSVDLNVQLGPICGLPSDDKSECCYFPLGYGGGSAYGTPCSQVCEEVNRQGDDDAFCGRSDHSNYGNCFCGPSSE